MTEYQWRMFLLGELVKRELESPTTLELVPKEEDNLYNTLQRNDKKQLTNYPFHV